MGRGRDRFNLCGEQIEKLLDRQVNNARTSLHQQGAEVKRRDNTLKQGEPKTNVTAFLVGAGQPPTPAVKAGCSRKVAKQNWKQVPSGQTVTVLV